MQHTLTQNLDWRSSRFSLCFQARLQERLLAEGDLHLHLSVAGPTAASATARASRAGEGKQAGSAARPVPVRGEGGTHVPAVDVDDLVQGAEVRALELRPRRAAAGEDREPVPARRGRRAGVSFRRCAASRRPPAAVPSPGGARTQGYARAQSRHRSPRVTPARLSQWHSSLGMITVLPRTFPRARALRRERRCHATSRMWLARDGPRSRPSAPGTQ